MIVLLTVSLSRLMTSPSQTSCARRICCCFGSLVRKPGYLCATHAHVQIRSWAVCAGATLVWSFAVILLTNKHDDRLPRAQCQCSAASWQDQRHSDWQAQSAVQISS